MVRLLLRDRDIAILGSAHSKQPREPSKSGGLDTAWLASLFLREQADGEGKLQPHFELMLGKQQAAGQAAQPATEGE